LEKTLPCAMDKVLEGVWEKSEGMLCMFLGVKKKRVPWM
jgi:hypothetical protein